MHQKSIVIIGAGMGGMAAGIYGQLNGFSTRIFEMHSLPGGQCASWKRKGYTFDGCIHHLMGCRPGSRLNLLWEELGAMPRELCTTEDCVSVCAPDGREFRDYYDPARLRDHLLSLAPADRPTIEHYLRGIELASRRDIGETMIFDGMPGLLKAAPLLWQMRSYLKPTLAQYAERFTDPLLRHGFPLVEYSMPDAPLFLHIMKHADGAIGGIKWPAGGAHAFARSIEQRYLSLGGQVHYKQKVTRILTEGHRAVIGLLEARFPGLRGQVETVDVPTLLTWERFMGGTHGFANMPKRPFNVFKSLSAGGMETTLPGLERFHFAGAWATSAGALFMNALSGRVVLQTICKAEGRRFTAPHRL